MPKIWGESFSKLKIPNNLASAIFYGVLNNVENKFDTHCFFAVYLNQPRKSNLVAYDAFCISSGPGMLLSGILRVSNPSLSDFS